MSYRKYTLNKNYFKEIDTYNKAYFLGLLYADGNVYKGVISTCLQERDSYILQKLKEELGSNRPLFLQIKTIPNHQNTIHLTINSVEMVKCLSKHGLHANKSFTKKFPTNLKKELMPHFIRGYFDGNGSVWNGKRKEMIVKDLSRKEGYRKRIIHNVKFNIFSNTNFIKSLSNYLEKEKIINEAKINIYNKNKNIASLERSGRKQLYKFYNYIYTNSDVYLIRKKLKFEEIFNYCAIIK